MAEPSARRPLTAWASDEYSQNGEDGMVAEVLRRLGIGTGTCVEFGAHDGLTNANTARLWHDGEWTALLVEPDRARYEQVRERAAGRRCTVVHGWVRPDGDDRLDRHLERASMPPTVDVLSIDVDGDDLAILRSLATSATTARVLLCEYNPTIPWHLRVEGPPGSWTGCSLGALVDAAEAQAYLLVGVTATNGIFVRHDDAAAFDDLVLDLPSIAPTDGYTYVVSDFVGRVAVTGPLPYPFRPGRPSFEGLPTRTDVRLRWTVRGFLSSIASAGRNTRAAVSGRPLRERLRIVADRLRR